jgi:hypothetical protein
LVKLFEVARAILVEEAKRTGKTVERTSEVTFKTLLGPVEVASPYVYDREAGQGERPMREHFGIVGGQYSDGAERPKRILSAATKTLGTSWANHRESKGRRPMRFSSRPMDVTSGAGHGLRPRRHASKPRILKSWSGWKTTRMMSQFGWSSGRKYGPAWSAAPSRSRRRTFGLKEGLQEHFPHLEFILDWCHLKHHLYETGERLLDEDILIRDVDGWVEGHLDTIYEGEAGAVIGELENLLQSLAPPPDAEGAEDTESAYGRLQRLINYLTRCQKPGKLTASSSAKVIGVLGRMSWVISGRSPRGSSSAKVIGSTPSLVDVKMEDFDTSRPPA